MRLCAQIVTRCIRNMLNNVDTFLSHRFSKFEHPEDFLRQTFPINFISESDGNYGICQTGWYMVFIAIEKENAYRKKWTNPFSLIKTHFIVKNILQFSTRSQLQISFILSIYVIKVSIAVLHYLITRINLLNLFRFHCHCYCDDG